MEFLSRLDPYLWHEYLSNTRSICSKLDISISILRFYYYDNWVFPFEYRLISYFGCFYRRSGRTHSSRVLTIKREAPIVRFPKHLIEFITNYLYIPFA